MKYLWLFIGLPFLIHGQTSSSVPDLLNCTQQMLGTNDVLVSGTPYIATHTNAKGSPFFQSKITVSNTRAKENSMPVQLRGRTIVPTQAVVEEQEVFQGEVYIKGQHFSKEYLSYDLEADKLILYKKLKNGVPYDIALYDNIVDSFSLNNHLFISQKNLVGRSQKEGYLERLFNGKFSFYRSQKVYFINQFTEKTPYGKFSSPQMTYFIFYKNEWNKVSSFKDFLQLFPDQAKEIKRFAKKEKIRFKKADDNQFTRLLKFSHEQL